MNEVKFKFEFSFADVVKIVKGLQELPYKESNTVIQYINDTYYKQQQELEKEAKAKAAQAELPLKEEKPQLKKSK
jgi:hypothetical protein